MKLQPSEVTAIIKKEIENYDDGLKMESVGSVISVGDGVARVHGLDGCMMSELLEFPNNVRGVALNHLVGMRFRVGDVLLEGARLNVPCKYLEMMTGKAVYQPLLNRSGLNCIILEGGTIRPGDTLSPA